MLNWKKTDYVGKTWQEDRKNIIIKQRKAFRNSKKYYQANKEKIYEHVKEKRRQDKINSVVSKLENTSMEELAKILIQARKTKLLAI